MLFKVWFECRFLQGDGYFPLALKLAVGLPVFSRQLWVFPDSSINLLSLEDLQWQELLHCPHGPPVYREHPVLDTGRQSREVGIGG